MRKGSVADQPVHFVEQFLGASASKGGSEDLAAVGKRGPKDLSQPFEAMLAAFVEAVAVGGFEDEEIAGRTCPFQEHESRPQDVAGLMEGKADLMLQPALFAILEAPRQPLDTLCRVFGILFGLMAEKLMASFSMGRRVFSSVVKLAIMIGFCCQDFAPFLGLPCACHGGGFIESVLLFPSPLHPSLFISQ